MIISYAPIHHVEQFEGQEAYDTARAEKITAVAYRHRVFTCLNADGDTSYLEAPLALASLTFSTEGAPKLADPAEEKSWRTYVGFLADLEESNIGHLLYEVETNREWALLRTLLLGGEDPCTLSHVDVEYRISDPAGDRAWT